MSRVLLPARLQLMCDFDPFTSLKLIPHPSHLNSPLSAKPTKTVGSKMWQSLDRGDLGSLHSIPSTAVVPWPPAQPRESQGRGGTPGQTFPDKEAISQRAGRQIRDNCQ